MFDFLLPEQKVWILYIRKKKRERVSTVFSLGVKFCNNRNFDLNFILGEKANYFNFILNTLF